MRIRFAGGLPFGVTAKDMILGAIGRIGVSGGVGHVIEYAGEVIEGLSMESRMTICNMSIEAGARAGLIAPDDTTFAYLEGKPAAPKGADWERALDDWRGLVSDESAVYDLDVEIDVRELAPQVTWGTNPGMVTSVEGAVRGRGARQGLRGRGIRMAPRRMLDVPGHERGHPLARRALRLDVQPEFRRPPGTRRTDAPRQPGHGCRGRARRPFRRHP